MKKNLLSKFASFVGLCVSVVSMQATTLSLVDVVGIWDPGYNNPTDTEMAANKLVVWYNGGTNPNPDVTAVFVLNPSGPLAPLPVPLSTAGRDDDASVSPLFSGVEYVVGKYATMNVLFYGAPYSSFYLPDFWATGRSSAHQLSHWQSFNARVPDGGWTVALVGSALAVMALYRRRQA